MNLHGPEERIEIGSTVKMNYQSSIAPGEYLVVGEIFWGMHNCGKAPSRKLFLYDPVNQREMGEYNETSLVKIEEKKNED